VDLERLVRGCGVDFLGVVDPYDHDALKDVLNQAKGYTFDEDRGVSVVITRRPCVRAANASPSTSRFLVGPNCDLCMTCVKDLECPAIHYVKGEKRMEIDEDLCAGCGFCVQVCPSQAIEARGPQ
jgi:indolepyruvate ferredoxin oxidoreductase, alpha subunit